jgi:hypothetical protein
MPIQRDPWCIQRAMPAFALRRAATTLNLRQFAFANTPTLQ